MTDIIPKPVNPVGNLGNTNPSIAVNSQAATANSAVRVVVSEINARQVVLTNADSRQSVVINNNQFSSIQGLNVGQSYALTVQDSSSQNALNKQADASSLRYLLSPIVTSNSAKPAANIAANVLINNNQLNSLLAVISKQQANTGVVTSPVTVQASVQNVQGNQVTLRINGGNGLDAQTLKVNLSNQVARLLSNGQSLSISIQLVNDKAKVLSVSTPNQLTTGQLSLGGISGLNSLRSLNAALAGLSQANLDKISIPDNVLRNVISQSERSNSVASGQSSNTSDSLLNLNNQKSFTLNSRLLDALPKNIAQTLTDNILVQGKVAQNVLDKGIQASLIKQGGQLSIQLNAQQNSQQRAVQLSQSQASKLVPGFGNSLNPTPQNLEKNVQLSKNESATNQQQTSSSNARHSGFGNISQSLYSPSLLAAKRIAENAAAISNNAADSKASATKINASDTSLEAKVSINVGNRTFVKSAELSEQLAQLLSNRPLSVSTAFLPNGGDKTSIQTLTQLQNLISQLGKQVLPKTSEQTQSFDRILSALDDQQAWSPDLQKLLSKVKDLLPRVDNSAALNDASTIKQIIAQSINPAPLLAINASAQNGFLNALVTLLQVSLASRLQKKSNYHASKVQEAIPEIVKRLIPNLSQAQGAKLSQEFNQFDAKHLLSAEISKLMANHQHNKLKSADSAVQGQDTLFYSFPNMFNKDGKDIEILLKKEFSEPEEGQKKQDRQTKWILNLKFDIAEQGEMLAKTSLIDQQIDLQIYTSTEGLRDQVLDKLPLLKKRLTALGIDLVSKGCQLGKIPSTLDSRHYSVFETDA